MSKLFGLKQLRLRARNLKCFEDWQGFDSIYPINLIVGRNNSGKSAILDLIMMAIEGLSQNPQLSRKGQPVSIEYSYKITKDMIDCALKKNIQIQGYGNDPRRFAMEKCVGLQTTRIITGGGQPSQDLVSSEGHRVNDPSVVQMTEIIRTRLLNSFSKMIPIRLRADRDIRPEQSGQCDHVNESGENATRLIEYYLNRSANHDLVETNVLTDLNSIIQPDWSFRRIFPKSDNDNNWELNLEDETRTVIPLSHTGSGLKTLLLVLINIHLVPHAKNCVDLSRFVFCFEELENNLHPAVQRRLFKYLRDKAVANESTFFLTTHSNVVIDLFSRDTEAQVFHISHDRKKASVQLVTNNLKRCSVLDDLGVRASDLLQANVVVWVEGPSDRLYFNQWIKVWCSGELQEAVHYQCLPYGGSLIADWSFADSEVIVEELASALQINRNAILLIDSDKDNETAQLEERASRVLREVQTVGGLGWVTAGRTIENYIPARTYRTLFDDEDLTLPGQYSNVIDHLKGVCTVEGKTLSTDKVTFARRVCPHITKEGLEETLDMKEQLDKVCDRIRKWNGLLD